MDSVPYVEPMSNTTSPFFDELAFAVAADGVAAHAAALRTLAERALASGVPARLVALLTDDTQPEVARQRALGKVLALLDNVDGTPETPAAPARVLAA